MSGPGERSALEIQQLMKAMSHPLRARILRILDERTASPSEIARELDAGLDDVSYHARRLVDLEQIELVHTRPVRGALEHFYRVTANSLLDSREWDVLDPIMRRTLIGESMREVLEDFRASASVRLLGGDTDSWLNRTPLVFDAEGIEEARRATERALEELMNIEARSTARLLREKADGIPVAACQGLFKLPHG